MVAKTVQLSTRVTDQDASFLAGLQIEGAKTPSDKLRVLIDNARRRHEGDRNYDISLRHVSDLMAPAIGAIRQAENNLSQQSKLVLPLIDWCIETVAFILSESPSAVSVTEAKSVPKPKQSVTKKQMVTFERGLADRLFGQLESILRLGVTKESPCYDTHLIADRLAPIVDLLRIIETVSGENK